MADEPSNLDDIVHAHAEIDAMHAIAADSDVLAEAPAEGYTVYDVEQVGRYVVPYYAGWLALRDMVRDTVLGIGFSVTQYPRFDGIIAEAFGQAALTDITDPKYTDAFHTGLRENLAAVRNYLMQLYYDELHEGMKADEAAKALHEIATYVGSGLQQHARHQRPHPDPSQPFIDMHLAAAPDGNGAQYLYEKILEMDRQSNWLRPFSAIVALFGGKTNHDWMLPAADATPFHLQADASRDALSSEEEIDAALLALDAEEAKQRTLSDALAADAITVDLETLGSQLIYTAENLKDVRAMSEPVRQDAIDIAKDILRKLKVSIGELNVLDGLGMRPRDDLNELGGIRAVVLVYERLLAWGRGIDATIMQHPSILAATQAIGQLGFIAKMDAKRIAELSGNLTHAQQLQAQLANVPQAYTKPDDQKMGALLDKVERGIDTVLNRVVTITGPAAAVGHSRDKEIGSYMSGTPIAGTAMQVSSEGVNRDATGRQQAAIQEGQNAANRAQVQRVTQQIANQSRTGSVQTQSTARNNTVQQLNAMRQRLQARRSQIQQNQVGLRTNANRNAMLANLHHDDHDHDPAHHQPPPPMAAAMAKLDPRLINSIKQMNTTTAGLTSNPVLTGRAAFDKMRNANTYGMNTTGAKPMTDEEKKKQQLQAPPPPPKKDGRSI